MKKMAIKSLELNKENLNKLSDEQIDSLLLKLAQRKGAEPQYYNKFDRYRPTIPARYYHLSMADVIKFEGGNGSAKTYTATAHDCAYLLGRPPKSMESIWCRPIPKKPVNWRVNGVDDRAIWNYLWKAFEEILPPGTIVGRNKEKKVLSVKSIWSEVDPSTVEFMTYEMEIEAHMGATLDGIRFDEQPPKIEYYLESVKRLRKAKPFNIMFSMTAEHGKTWIFDVVDEKARRKYISIPNPPPVKKLPENAVSDEFTRDRHIEIQDYPMNDKQDPTIEVINATVYDNPYVTDEYIVKFYNTLKDYPEKLQINILGKTVSLYGLVIPEYRREKHFIQQPIELHPDYPYFEAIDDHTDFFAYTLACMTPPKLSTDKRGIGYLVKDRRLTGTLDDICKEIRMVRNEKLKFDGKEYKRWILWTIADPRVGMKDIRKGRTLIQDMADSIHQCDYCHGEMELTIDKKLCKRFGYCKKCDYRQEGIIVRPSHKDKERGILLVRNALRYDEKEKIEPRLFLLKDAINTDYELRHWVYKDNKPKDEDDHWMSNIERLFQEVDFRYRERESYMKPIDMNKYLWAS